MLAVDSCMGKSNVYQDGGSWEGCQPFGGRYMIYTSGKYPLNGVAL